MPLRGIVVCALLVLVAGNAAAVNASTHPRNHGWVNASDVAQAARDRAAAAAVRQTRAPDPLAGDPGTGVLGTDLWTGGGIPVCTTASGQFGLDAVTDNAGGVIAGWIDYRDLHYDVYAMRLDGFGNRLWSPGGALVCPNDGVIDQLVVMPDGAGGAFFLMGVSDGIGGLSDVLVQHMTSAGAIASGWAQTGRSTVPSGASGFGAVPTNDGSLLMGWVDLVGQLRLVRLTGAGAVAPGWNAAGLALGHPENDGNIRPASDGAGGGYICWAESDSVRLTRVAAAGGFAGGWDAAGAVVARGLSTPPLGLAVAPLAGGDAMAFWADFRNLTDTDIFAMRYTAAGAPAPGWAAGGVLALGGTDYQMLPDAVSDGAGGALMVCQWSGTPGSPDSLVAQRMTGSATLAAGWTANGVTPARHPGKSSAPPISDGLNGIIVAWNAVKSADDDIFAARVGAGGSIFAGWPSSGQTICAETGSQNEVKIVTDGAGGLIAVWEDYRDVAERVYAARVLSDGTVAAVASLVSASAAPGLARLHWFSPDGARFVAGLERAAGEGPFVEIARVYADGTGHVRYDDRDVVGGETYHYRLAVSDGGTTRYLGAVTLRVPTGSRLALAGFVPNPAVGTPRLAYALPGAEPARIEVLDTAGRRVLERDLDSSPGEHAVSFEDTRLGPGIYVLRLTQGSRSVTARAAIVR